MLTSSRSDDLGGRLLPLSVVLGHAARQIAGRQGRRLV